eukprot:5815057-Amphidinium_carterae.1
MICLRLHVMAHQVDLRRTFSLCAHYDFEGEATEPPCIVMSRVNIKGIDVGEKGATIANRAGDGHLTSAFKPGDCSIKFQQNSFHVLVCSLVKLFVGHVLMPTQGVGVDEIRVYLKAHLPRTTAPSSQRNPMNPKLMIQLLLGRKKRT